jgi:phosphoglycerate dehydrogenase-like enzyme
LKNGHSGETLPMVALLLSEQLQKRLFTAGSLQQLASLAIVVQFPEGRQDAEALLPLLKHASICITGWDTPSLPSSVLENSPHLRLIAHTAGTVHHLFDPSIFVRGIRVTHSAAALAEGVAEFTIAQALLSLTQLHTFDQLLRRRASWEEMRNQPVGHLLSA